MHPALIHLIVLGHKGALRRLWRGARTVRGVLLMLFVFGFIILPPLSQIIAFRNADARKFAPFIESARTFAPLMLLVMALFTIFTSAGERAIYFTPAEVDFLFPGPFTRRELLLYRLGKSAPGLIVVSLFFSAYELMYLSSWLCGFIGLVLTLAMVQLLGMASALVGQTVAESLYTRARRVVLAIVLVLLGWGLAPVAGHIAARGASEVLGALRESTALKAATAPFQIFTRAIFARAWFFEGLAWSAAALAVDLGLLALVLRLDAHYLEMAAGVSAKVYERIRNARAGGGLTAPVGDRAKRIRLPHFAWLGGAGPIAWRQTLMVARTSRGVLVVVLLLGGFPAMFGWFARSGPHGPGGAGVAMMGIGMMVYLSLLVVPQLPWAFRGDVDHIDFLKSLPARPLAVAIGELAGGVAALTFAEFLLFLVYAAVAPAGVAVLGAAALFLLPFNLLMFALGNFLFLLYPVRAPAGGTFDFQLMGKVMLLLMMQILLLLAFSIVPALVGGLILWLVGPAWIALGAAWLAVAAELPLPLWAVARAFDRFDPSTQVPAE